MIRKNDNKEVCIPENVNMNKQHQITFVNSQHQNTNLKSNFVLKTGLNVRFKDFWYMYKSKSDSDLVG